jgi:acetyltransferase-like isoleucine patch superfamily enzyme
MIKLVKRYLDKRPSIQNIICHYWVPLMKKQSAILGTFFFSTKAKWYGIECNGKVVCFGKVDLVRSEFSQIVFGDNVLLVSSSSRATATSIYAPIKIQTFSPTSSIIIGDNVGLNGTSIVARSKQITIGAGTMIAPNVVIMDSDFHIMWPPENRTRNPAYENDRDVTIGKNVWIGIKSIILKGSIIGDNSIIGAGSVVTGIIPENVLAVGNPAKVIRQLKA